MEQPRDLTAFAAESGKKDVVSFALNQDRAPFAFAGIWTEFEGDRGTKSKAIPGPHLVYGPLTTSPNEVIASGVVRGALKNN